MGKSVSDLSRHFVQYWNYANYQLYLTESQLMMFTGIHEEQLEVNGMEVEEEELNNLYGENKFVIEGLEEI